MSSLARTLSRSVRRQGFSDKQIDRMSLFAFTWQEAKAHKREQKKNGIHAAFTPSFVKFCNYQVEKILKKSAWSKK